MIQLIVFEKKTIDSFFYNKTADLLPIGYWSIALLVGLYISKSYVILGKLNKYYFIHFYTVITKTYLIRSVYLKYDV